MTSIIEQLAFARHDAEASFEDVQIEYEVEGYLKGFDLEEIKSRSSAVEHQEQWGIYVPKTDANASAGSLRVRKSIAPDLVETYVQTTKLQGDAKGKPEAEHGTNVDLFEMYKQMADQGLVKVRYDVPAKTVAEGIDFKFELDVFYNNRGELVPWVKIDAELPEGIKLTKEDFNFACEEMIIVTPEDKINNVGGIREKIGELYTTYFRTTNMYV